MTDLIPVDHDPFGEQPSLTPNDPSVLSPTPIAANPQANAQFGAAAPQASPPAPEPHWSESIVNAIPDWLIPADEKQAALARARYYQQTGQQPTGTEGANYALHTLDRQGAVHKAEALAQPTQDLVHNWVTGPLSAEGQAQGAPVAAAFQRIAQGGTGDPDQDRADIELASGHALNTASWMGMPGIGRAAALPAGAADLGLIGGKLGGSQFPAGRAALAHAEQLADHGVPNDSIGEITGWRKGVEGTWEFELPDTGMKVKPYDPAVHNDRLAKVSDFVSHPLLEQAYGDFLDKNVKVYVNPEIKGNHEQGGLVLPEMPGDPYVIHLKPDEANRGDNALSDRQASTLLHETNHVISKVEGRSTGGNPTRIEAQTFMPLRGEGYLPSSISGMEHSADWQYYQHLADEVRSRVIQARAKMTPEQLKAEPYYETARRMGFPEEDQIVPPPKTQWPKPKSGYGFAQESDLSPANKAERNAIIAQMKERGLLPPEPDGPRAVAARAAQRAPQSPQPSMGAGAEMSMGPNSGVKLVPGQPGQPDFYIRHPNGRDVGFVNVDKTDPKNVHIENIQLYDAWNNPGQSLKGTRGMLGAATIRDLKRQLQQHFDPGMGVSGERFSGARFGGEWLNANDQDPVSVRVRTGNVPVGAGNDNQPQAVDHNPFEDRDAPQFVDYDPFEQSTAASIPLPRPAPQRKDQPSDPSRADPFHFMLSALTGVPINVARTIGDIESRNKPDLGTNSAGYTGLYQQGKENIPRGWSGSLREPGFNTKVTANTLKTNQSFFQKQMGRAPDVAEDYMMHNQGLVGGTALVRAAQREPDLPAYQALSKYASSIGRKMNKGVAFQHIAQNMWGDLAKKNPRTVTAGQWVQAVRDGVGDKLAFYDKQFPQDAGRIADSSNVAALTMPIRHVPLPSNPSAARRLMRELPPPQRDRATAL